MARPRHGALLSACLLGAALTAQVVRAQEAPEPEGAAWELRALGVPVGERLDAVRARAGRRSVTLAIVGQGGVSETRLAPVLGEFAALEYRDGAVDPGSNTHDTQAARVILDLTSRLGVRIRLLVYQPGEAFAEVATAMAHAGAEADLVAFFQSFWGPDARLIAEAIAAAEGCLFVSPYVEYRSYPTSTCTQAHSARPWAEGLPNFVTAAPVAFRDPGRLLRPAGGAEDTEIINFLAPSWYASGAGGTCPAGEVTAALAAYVVAASPMKPVPAEIVAALRDTAAADERLLAQRLAWEPAAVTELVEQITSLSSPDPGPRKLDAAGVLDLWGIYQRMDPDE